MSRVKVYKTDVRDRSKAAVILKYIKSRYPGCDASFDLEDSDKVLRIVDPDLAMDEAVVKKIIHAKGHLIEKLP